ncbi:phosphotransferase [Streptomyces sp. NBC_01565]|uniref:phosphotransferase n=1 Tax=unclassified Streptomyces TaxID=2593676 RepID=UPI0022505164|nr:phosphotransferase [Streptomyces sp. NBC_01565]MCX4546884.1 phosphotransferase [Streptomyces sp. NBC_01565]
MSTESGVADVAGILRRCYRILPAWVVDGPQGTATRNFLAEDQDSRRWFIKAYPPGTDLQGEQEALRLAEFARRSGVPVPAVRVSPVGELIVTAGESAVSVSAYLDGAHTTEGGLHGRRWAAVGEAVGHLHRALARHPAGPPRPVSASEVWNAERASANHRPSRDADQAVAAEAPKLSSVKDNVHGAA